MKLVLWLIVINMLIIVIDIITLRKKLNQYAEDMDNNICECHEWVPEEILSTKESTYMAYRCDKCGYLSHSPTRYCANCGSKME